MTIETLRHLTGGRLNDEELADLMVVIEREIIKARIDEIEMLGNYKEQYEGRYDLYDTALDRIAQLNKQLFAPQVTKSEVEDEQV